MYPFDTKQGLIVLGLTVASGGGWLLSGAMQLTKDPRWLQLLQLLIVFWLTFVGKTTWHYVRLLEDRSAAAAAARAQAAAVGGGDSSGTPERPTRQRRTRRA